jgi:hypothetical protein
MPPPSGSRRVFGQSMGRSSNGKSSYQRQFGGGKQGPSSNATAKDDGGALLAAKRRLRQQKAEQIDRKFGYETFEFHNTNDSDSGESRQKRGWLFNVLPTSVSHLS